MANINWLDLSSVFRSLDLMSTKTYRGCVCVCARACVRKYGTSNEHQRGIAISHRMKRHWKISRRPTKYNTLAVLSELWSQAILLIVLLYDIIVTAAATTTITTISCGISSCCCFLSHILWLPFIFFGTFCVVKNTELATVKQKHAKYAIHTQSIVA